MEKRDKFGEARHPDTVYDWFGIEADCQKRKKVIELIESS